MERGTIQTAATVGGTAIVDTKSPILTSIIVIPTTLTMYCTTYEKTLVELTTRALFTEYHGRIIRHV